VIQFLDVLYLGGLLVASPLLLARLARDRRLRGELRLGERLGGPPRAVRRAAGADPRPIWIHAASVGELNAARTFIEAAERRFAPRRCLVSTFTRTGLEQARERYGADRTFCLPLDLSFAAARFLEDLRPACIVLVELELWPNLLRQAARRGVPVVVVNGRITERNARRLRRLAPLLGTLRSGEPRLFCVQNETYRDRLVGLGVPHRRIRVTGALKYDAVRTEVPEPERERLRRALGLETGTPLWVAGSTWPGEEEVVLAVFKRLRGAAPGLRLLIAPKHIERAGAVERLVREAGLRPVRRSRGASEGLEEVLILDSMGELVTAYSLASAAFVGRSLGDPRRGGRGGQNLLEPAALGVPTVFGPHVENFRDVAERLVRARGCRQVNDAEGLYVVLRRLLDDPAERTRMAQAARAEIERRRGATERHVAAVAEVIESVRGPGAERRHSRSRG